MTKKYETNLSATDYEATKWLYDAALAEASRLSPINVTGKDFDRQLVLVRYTKELISNGFSKDLSLEHGAMWTNTVTCKSPLTYHITGGDRGQNWKGLNVVRLGLPSGFTISDATETGLIRHGFTNIGMEYWLSFDIPCNSFSTIPFDFDADTEQFVQQCQQAQAFDESGWLPKL